MDRNIKVDDNLMILHNIVNAIKSLYRLRE